MRISDWSSYVCSSDLGEAFLARVDARITGIDQIGNAVVANREGVPVRVRDVADVTIGGDLRTGAASQNGEKAVIGTALMLLGENSRTVASDAGEQIGIASSRGTVVSSVMIHVVTQSLKKKKNI